MEYVLVLFVVNSGFDWEMVELGVLSVLIVVVLKYLLYNEIFESVSVYVKKVCRMILQVLINVFSVEQV